jgi:hypothetical protein
MEIKDTKGAVTCLLEVRVNCQQLGLEESPNLLSSLGRKEAPQRADQLQDDFFVVLLDGRACT